MKKSYRIQYKRPERLWYDEEPWSVITYDGIHMPSEEVFATEEEAKSYVTLKMLEQ